VIDYLLDGGDCPVGVASTIVDLTGAEPVILRQGAISREAIDAALVEEA
jgi:L-threonylcarbamoyladenylate synthase